MADRGIIFSAPMVRALLDGRKTQTRRALNPQPDMASPVQTDGIMGPRARLAMAKHAAGDRLYVREAWRTADAYDDLPPRDLGGEEAIRYEVDGHVQTWGWPESGPIGRYRHARFMPRWASRLTLIVTDVRVLRLHEIGEADAVAEGCGRDHVAQLDSGDLTGVTAVFNGTLCADHRDAMRETWAELHGAGAWAANPWVAAITFTVHRCNIDQMPGGRG